ncbi:MAG: hypothetical protein ABL867_05520 [Rickettsiales bacterium]
MSLYTMVAGSVSAEPVAFKTPQARAACMASSGEHSKLAFSYAGPSNTPSAGIDGNIRTV